KRALIDIETVEHCETPRQCQFEDLPGVVRSTIVSCAIKIAIRCLNQGTVRESAIDTRAAEAMDRLDRTGRSHTENRSGSECPAIECGPVEVSVRGQNQRVKCKARSVVRKLLEGSCRKLDPVRLTRI